MLQQVYHANARTYCAIIGKKMFEELVKLGKI
jgi:hypothetical protein